VRTILLIVLSLAVLGFAGCENSKLQKYKSIVHRASRFEVQRTGFSQATVVPASEIDRFKDVLTSGIEPETQRYFTADTRIDFYFDDQRIGSLLIQNGKSPFANFNSDHLNFGFRLTYQMGMWIGVMTGAPRP
jgi:hypothetical protein